MAGPSGSGPSAAAFTGVEEWRSLTVALTPRYVRLQVSDPLEERSYPVIPLGLTDSVILVALPQRFVPWRPPAFVRLADDVSGDPARDGASVAVSVVALAAEAALLLEPVSEYALRWGLDDRWPFGGDLRAIDYGPAAISRGGVNLAEATSGPPPTEEGLGPSELDALFAGALNSGPWTGLMSLPWPPAEPEDEEERPMPSADERFGPHSPEDEFMTNGDEGANERANAEEVAAAPGTAPELPVAAAAGEGARQSAADTGVGRVPARAGGRGNAGAAVGAEAAAAPRQPPRPTTAERCSRRRRRSSDAGANDRGSHEPGCAARLGPSGHAVFLGSRGAHCRRDAGPAGRARRLAHRRTRPRHEPAARGRQQCRPAQRLRRASRQHAGRCVARRVGRRPAEAGRPQRRHLMGRSSRQPRQPAAGRRGCRRRVAARHRRGRRPRAGGRRRGLRAGGRVRGGLSRG